MARSREVARTGLPACVTMQVSWYKRKGYGAHAPARLAEQRASLFDTIERRSANCVEFVRAHGAALASAPQTIPLDALKSYVDDLDVLRRWSTEVAALDVLIGEMQGGKVIPLRSQLQLVVLEAGGPEPAEPEPPRES